MKVSTLQSTLSYLVPITIKKVKETGQKAIKLQLYKGQFQLSYGLVYYSDGKDYFPFRKAFRYLGDKMLTQQSILVLGSGIGSIGMILSDLYPLHKWHLNYVDVNPHILKMCEDVMGHYPNIIANYTLQDALQFVQKPEGVFDLICIDIFDEHIVPKQIFTEGFFQNIKNTLNTNGVCVLNAMFLTDHQQMGFEKVIKSLFEPIHTIGTKKNVIYVLSK